jgi:hypothetical protein
VLEKYKVGNYSFLILSADGEVIVKYTGHPSPEKVSAAIEGTADHRQGLEAIAKLKEKGKPAENAGAIGTALKKVGMIESEKSLETIMEYVKDDKLPVELRATAIGALNRQSAAAKDLVGFLTDKKYPLKAAATTSLKSLGMDSMPALFEGLAADDAELRVACHAIATATTKNAKLSKDVGVWKSGKADAREKALKEWKDWYDAATKPKEPPKLP